MAPRPEPGDRPLAALVEATGPGLVEAAIFGTSDPAVIAERLCDLTVAALGASVVGARFYVASVDAVAGVTLSDGREVVVRAYEPGVDERFVDAAVRVQGAAAAAGFPAPVPVGPLVRTSWGRGRLEEVLADPGPSVPGHDDLPVSAGGLAWQVRLAAGVDPSGLELHPMELPDDGLYPRPHSPVFDFEATRDGASWIDAVAEAARAAMPDASAPSVIAHGDWSARNVRIRDGRLVAAFDWESVMLRPEPHAVGIAAATWTALGAIDDPIAPSPEGVLAYVDAYAAERATPFEGGERRSACASALFAIAYTARCEHARRPGDRSGRAAARLASDADQFLDLLRS